MGSRLTEKLAKVQKNVCAPCYMATRQHQKKSKQMLIQKWNDKCTFHRILGVNSVVMNYKIRLRESASNKASEVQPYMTRPFFLLLLFVVAEKQKNMVWTCEAMCKGSYGGRLGQCVSQQSIGQSQLVDELCYLLNLGFARTRSQILCSQLSDEQRIGNPANVFL